MRNVLLILLAFIFLTNSKDLSATVQYSAPFSKIINFSIKESSVLFTSQDETETIVREQLKYLFGSLNEIDAGIDFPELKIKILGTQSHNGATKIVYSAKGTIAWDLNRAIPTNYNFILPLYGDAKGITAFLNKYQKVCAKKVSYLNSFWNYYRPQFEDCPLRNTIPDDAILVTADFSISDSDRSLRELNLKEIFKDKIIESTIIITKFDPQSSQDPGMSEFINLCNHFQATRSDLDECHGQYYIEGILVKAHIFIVKDFNDNPKEFLNKLAPYVTGSDFISFNGHAGMGVNIESFMQFYPVPKLKYQLIFLNSCDTFGYFKNNFFSRINLLNTTTTSSNLSDIILNATPNWFGTFASSNLSIIKGIILKEEVSKILYHLPVDQKPIHVFEDL